jgi:hypothetical protein
MKAKGSRRSRVNPTVSAPGGQCPYYAGRLVENCKGSTDVPGGVRICGYKVEGEEKCSLYRGGDDKV